MSTGSKPNIAFVVAHPDDLAHAMGGTAWLLKERYKLHVFCASKGERGYPDPQRQPGQPKPPRPEFGDVRAAEEAAACRLLDAELTFLGQIDGEIYADQQTCSTLAQALATLSPVALFTLWPVNVPDHIAVSAMATKALSLSGAYHSTEVYFCENGMGGQTNQFVPDLYVNISDVIEHKRELVRCHKTQNRDEAAVENVLKRNVLRGMFARCNHAEPFKTPDPLVNARWGRKTRYLLLDL